MARSPRRRIRYETELVKLIRKAGFYAVRVPASGRHDKHSIGDVSMCFNKTFLALEVKTTSKNFIYCSSLKGDARKMVKLARLYKAPCLFAIRFIDRTNGGWRFVKATDILTHKKILRRDTFRDEDKIEERLNRILGKD